MEGKEHIAIRNLFIFAGKKKEYVTYHFHTEIQFAERHYLYFQNFLKGY